ncbi:glycoside hydrolase [Chryseolinea sp. T2]|uniref:glycoside hydrolase n=1 Tax=Chryseolinea sp. T2 TaxID=3129255 RepID=UPI0030777CEB
MILVGRCYSFHQGLTAATIVATFSLTFALLLSACRQETTKPDVSAEQSLVVIDLADRKQTIEHFGASDAWSAQYAGLWPDAKRNQLADWLFSKEMDANGRPRGIGLSMWRFNIGAGSAGQGNIKDEWRAAECFLSDKGYDFTKQAGQQWFLEAARKRNVEKFLAFTNSPPVVMTANHKGFSSKGDETNLSPEKFDAFADFLVSVLKNFNDTGRPFDYISPFNEPQWDWTENSQEGTPFLNKDIYEVTKRLDKKLAEANLNTRIQISEAAVLNYLYLVGDKPGRGNQIGEFFREGSPYYVGGLQHVDKSISGHSYFSTTPRDSLREVRRKVGIAAANASVPLKFWQSEYCILGDQEEVKGSGRDTSIAPALYVARTIHYDLTVANASAWHWWLSISPYDYKDGLVYIDQSKTDGNITDSKLLWALGNFSRFIRPGAVRVNVSAEASDINAFEGALISSYVNADNEVVIVAINNTDKDREITFELKNGSVKQFKSYVTGTASDENLKPAGDVTGNKALLVRNSVTTFVGKME